MNRKNGVDFVIVSCYGHEKIDYTRFNVESINRYWKSVEHTIYLVVNWFEKELEMKLHKELFGDQDNIVILEGVDQTSKGIRHIWHHGGFTYDPKLNPNTPARQGLIDGCMVGAGGYYGSIATSKGVLEGGREYVCVLDQDAIFLNSHATELLKLLDKYKFVSNRWCPGSIFNYLAKRGTCDGSWGDGMARIMLMLCKRELYDEIESENYVERGIWKTSPYNCDYRDIGGQMTWYAKQKDYDWFILKNSYRDTFRKDNGLWKENLLDYPWGEQAWLDEIPIFFHATQGGRRGFDEFNRWSREVKKYLDIN
tara:strand:+ start:1476 stop:2405 length:930 start_codon:yes stop_codon:yes gene_type:complete